MEHLWTVYTCLRDAGLVINAEKCVFAATTIEFLGHKGSAAGVEPLRSHVQAVFAHPEPTNISELQAFLGTVNFYCRLLPVTPRTFRPLTKLLIGGHKGTEPVSFATRSEPLLWRPRTPWQWSCAWLTLPRASSSASWWIFCRAHRWHPPAAATVSGPLAAPGFFLLEA